MSDILRPDKAKDCVHWELPSVGDETAPGKRRLGTARQLEDLYELAYQEGHNLGQRKGRQDARKEAQERLRKFTAIIRALEKPLQRVDQEIEQQLVELAILVAKQIVRYELSVKPEQITEIVQQSLQRLPAGVREVSIYLHPDDVNLIREFAEQSGEEFSWQLHEDKSIERGGCRVETDKSRIDATVEAHIAAAARAVLNVDEGQV
ncbi:MAG: flagellar assembly protein FliH [Gammaproteobacteria bacterium]|nr:flagellar assembly protein FliH [Gammaproteobacteria bacterium]